MAPEQRTDRAPAEPMRAVDRALRLLVSVAETDDGISLADAARRTSLAPSTALRQLRGLEAAGFVARTADGRFTAGPTLTRLGRRAASRSSLAVLAEPHLRALASDLEESAYLAVRSDAAHGVYLAQAPSPLAIRHVSWLGELVPLEGSALGAALEDRVDPDGVAVRTDAVEAGVTAVSAPVHGPGGGVVGAVSLLGPAFRLRGPALAAARGQVALHATALAGEYGGAAARSVA
ncbi:MAG: helix-turn-helix domain-containing protein [Thermoleophilia bacterium]|nr:helix-turn-helix domain-containing protein [Thermoleophilia bacterium]